MIWKKRITFIFNSINYYLNILPRILRISILTNHTWNINFFWSRLVNTIRPISSIISTSHNYPFFFRETVTNNRKDRIESEIKGRRRDTQAGEVTFGQTGFDSCQAPGRIADARAIPERIFHFICFVFVEFLWSKIFRGKLKSN